MRLIKRDYGTRYILPERTFFGITLSLQSDVHEIWKYDPTHKKCGVRGYYSNRMSGAGLHIHFMYFYTPNEI